MQKCQHGLKISHFCIYEHCSSKQSSGCEDCVRRHHSHVGNSEIIKVEDVDSIAQKFSVQNSLKPKCRQLQEHVFGFFTLVKNQILQTIDIACKAMVNKIGYPFLSSLGHLSSYKKIKNKQYKKLSSKELRKFYKDTKSLNNDFVQSKEKQLYIEEIRQNLGTLQLLERLMKDYEACTKKLCKSFQHDSSSWKKVEQLKKYLISILKIDNSPISAKTTQKLQSVSIQKKPMNTKESLETSPSEEQNLFNPLYQKNRQSVKIQQQKQKDLKKSPNKQQQKASRNKYKQLRNFSIDRDLNKKVEQCYDIKITEEANSPGYVSKEKQILERKQKLMKMMSLKEKSVGKVLELVNISPPPLLTYQKSPNEKTKKIQRSDPSFINESNKSPEYNLKLSSPIKFENPKNHLSPRCQYQRQPNSSRSFKQQLLTQRNQQVRNQESDQNQNDEKYKYAVCRLPSSESNASQTQNFFKTAGFKHLKRELDSLISQNDFNRISQTSQKQIVDSDVMSSEEQKSACLYFKAIQLTKPEQIIKYLKASLKYNHKNISAAQHLSFIYNDQNKAKESLDLCNEYLGILTKLNASNQLKNNFVVNKSAALNLLGRYSEAIMLLEEQSLHIEEAKIFKNLGDSYFHVGINEKCQYNYEKAVKLNPNFDEAMYNLAVCLYMQRNYFNADVWIKKSLQIQPKKQDYLTLYHQISKKLAQVHEENQYLN